MSGGKPSKEDAFNALNQVPKWPLYVHVMAAVTCLGCSAVYHLFMCHSCSAYTILTKFDFAGIALLISGSMFPYTYYAFPCEKV